MLALLIVLAIIVIALARCDHARDRFYGADWGISAERENFSPDAPGSCSRNRYDYGYGSAEFGAFRVIAGVD